MTIAIAIRNHLWEEVVNEGAESETVRPAVREVGDVHVLTKSMFLVLFAKRDF